MNETLLSRASFPQVHLSCLSRASARGRLLAGGGPPVSLTLSGTSSSNIGAHRGLAKTNQRWQGKEKPPPEQQRPRVREGGLGAPPVAPTQPRQRRMAPEHMPRANNQTPTSRDPRSGGPTKLRYNTRARTATAASTVAKSAAREGQNGSSIRS